MQDIRVTGAEHEIRDIYQALIGNADEMGYRITKPVPARAGIGSRNPLGQVELVELVISFATGIASNAAYEFIRNAIKKKQQEQKIRVEESAADETRRAI